MANKGPYLNVKNEHNVRSIKNGTVFTYNGFALPSGERITSHNGIAITSSNSVVCDRILTSPNTVTKKQEAILKKIASMSFRELRFFLIGEKHVRYDLTDENSAAKIK